MRETELNASILAMGVPPGNGGVTKLPASIVAKIGNVLVGFDVAGNVSQLGPTSLPGLATLLLPVTVELAASFCSQQYVNASPGFASVAEPVNANGVLIGMV